MSIISVTERQLFKRCRRKWDYSSFSRQSLVPVVNTPALDLGSLVHATLEQWTQDPELDPEEIYSYLSLQHLKSLITTYTERVGCKPSKEELTPQTEAITLGSSMIHNYKVHWRTPLPAGFTLVQNEQTVLVNIPDTWHCKCTEDCYDWCHGGTEPSKCIPCSCGPHQLEATFDGIMADEHGQLFIIERKTYSRKPSIDELDRKDQFLAYMWALQQVLPSSTVVGVAYDGLQKRTIPVAGKTTADLFLRRILLRNKHELEEFGQLLPLEAMDMCDSNVRLYKNEPVLGGCWDCSFRPLCDAQSRGEQLTEVSRMYHRLNRKEWRATRDRDPVDADAIT